MKFMVLMAENIRPLASIIRSGFCKLYFFDFPIFGECYRTFLSKFSKFFKIGIRIFLWIFHP